MFSGLNTVYGSDSKAQANEGMLSSLLSEKSFSAYGDDLKGYIKELNGVSKSGEKASASIESFNEFLGKNGKQTVKTTTFMEDLESGIKSFGKTAGSALLNIGTDLLISGGIQAAAAGIDYVVNKQSNTIKAGSEVLSDYQNINQQMSESTSWVKTNAERYEELSKGVNNLGQNLSLTSADYEEYQQLSSQIAQQFPELVTGYDSLGKPIIGAAKSVSDLQTALKNAKFDAYNKNVKEAKDVTGKFYEEVMRSKTLPWQEAGSQKQLDGLKQFVKDYNKAFSTKDGNKPTGYIDLQKYMNMSTNAETGFNASDFGEAYQTLGLSQADIQDLIQDLNSSNGKLKSGSDSAKTLTTLMDGVGELQSDVDNSANELKQYIPSFLQANKKYQDLIWDNDGLDSKVTSMINAMTMEDLESNGFTDKDNAADNIKKWASNVVNELDKSDIRDSIDSLFSFNENHAEDTAKDWYTTANAALDEADAKSESFNKKQLQEASGIYDEWLKVKDAMASITSRYGDTTREDAIRRFNTEDLEALGEIASADTDHKLSYDDAISQIENQKRQAELSVANLQKSVESITSQYSTISSAISDSMSDTGLSKDSIDAVKSSVQDVISSTDELKDFDLDGLFTNTSKGVKLNNSQLENLLDIQKSIKEQDFAESISKQTDALDKQAKETELLKAKYGETSDEYVEALEKQKQAQEDLNATQQAQSQYYAQYQQQKQLFSDYAEWQRATQTENSGDKYLSMVSGLDTAKKAWDAGEIGTDDFKSFAKMISPSGATDPVNFAENYAKAARYLTSDEYGLVHFFEDLSTKTDAAGQAMASFNEETQSWELNTHDLGEVAQKLGTGTPVVEALFGRAEDYGATTTVISDMQDGILKATEATKNWSEAKARLDQMNEENAQAQKDGKDPIYNTTAIKAAEDEVAKYKQQIDGLQESMDYYAEHNLGSEAQQKKMKTAADEIKNIQEQVQKAEESGNKSLADAYRNMAKEKAAAAGITVDDNLNVTGDGKTAQQQLQEASKTSSVLSEDTFDYDKTNMSLDEIDSKINELQGKRADVEVAIQNGEESKQTLTALDTEVSALEAQKIQVQIQTAVENGNSLNELLTLSDQELMTTVGCDASQVDQVRDEIQEMSGEQIDMTVAMNSDQFVALINAITGEKIEVPVEANTDGVEAETKSAVEGTEAKVTPQVDTSQVESETQSAVQNATEGTKPSVEVTGNVTTLTAGTGLTPVAVTGNVVQLTGTPSQSVDVNANATSISGNPSGTVDVTANATNVSGNPSGTVDVQGNVTEASGSPSGTVDVKGNVTSVSGNPSGTVDVRGNLTGINNAENQSVSAKGTVEYTGVFPKQADTVKGTADYNPGVFPTSAPSVSGEAIYSGVFPTTAPSLTGTVTYHATVTGVPTKLWTGTMSAPASTPAHAFGTAYNAINFGNAYANGKVGLQHNEVALVNELGQESIVRGDRWLMLPPGMHTQALKKGDIVLNAQQTADLKKHGKATGTARAFAHGSLTDISPAHADVGAATLKFQGGLASPKYGNTKSTDKTTKNVDKAAKDVSKAAKDSSKWTDPWKNVKDWFERVVTKLQGIIDLNKAKSDNTYDYNKQNSYANNSISTTETLISKYRQAEKMYTKKSDQYAKKIGLSSKLKKKVQNGTVNIESLSAVNKQKVDAYQKWYDKILNCKKQIEELKTKEKELYKQKLDNITTRYDALIGVYSKANDSLDGLNSWREEIGASQVIGSDYYNAVQQKVDNGNQMRTYYKDEISALTKEYGNIVKKYGADSTFAKETLSQIEELKNTFYENEKTTAENTNKLAELNMTMAENEVDKYTRASDALSSYRDFKEKNSYKHSDYGNVTENDYVEAMKVNDKTILAYQHQKDLILTEMAKVSVDSPKYQEYAKQLADVNKNILEANNDTADLKKSLVELRFKPLEDARDTIELLVTDLDNLRDMMDSDTFMNDDGSMTKQGLANIALLNKASETTKQQLANDKAQLETIQQMYDNDLLTEDQYKQYIKDINSDIQKSSKAIYSYQQSLMQVYLDQISKENDYLQENINKRKTALTAKKDYYDYDKTLKSKNKDIDTIKAQIAALEGTTNAAAKARLEQLKADLKDKEDDLADTKYQHQIEIEEKGYENLSDQANDTLDKTTQAVKSNSDLQKSIIDNMLKETQKSYADAYEQIEEIIKNTGYSVSESFDEIIAKAKLTSEEVKKVSPSVTASGEGVDNQRTDKNQADQYTKNAANSSSTGANATKDYSNANPSANDLSESGTSGQQNAQLKNTVNNAKNVVSESMKEYNAKKSALQQWYNGVGGDVDKTKLKEKHHDFYTYFWKKGKNVRQKDFEEVARILGHNYIIKQPYSKWKKSWKDKIFNELKGYGFSNGGVINSVIPMDSNSIYGEYLSRSDDTGMIFARPGESVMTEKFTELLKPSLATMDQFTKLANPQGILPNTQMTNQDITFSPNIEINVDSISNDMDLKHLGKELADVMYPMFTKRMRKDLSRSSGKNR